MNENFDCTQFISFTLSKNPINKNIILLLKKEGFTLIEKNNIRKAKIDFFGNYIENQFYELKNDNFIGEFEDWIEESTPPKTIIKFIKIIEDWMYQLNVSHFKFILTSYAEVNGNTSCYVIKTTFASLLNELFKMSRYYYGEHYDTLIINISL